MPDMESAPPFDMPPPSAGFDARGGWVVNRLMDDLDITIIQAGGIVGNLGGESGLQAVQEKNPIAGRGGWGWEQATGDRRVNFEQFAAESGLDIHSDEANYDFLVKELFSSESHALRQLKKTTDLEAAVFTFEVLFERPFDPQGGLPARMEYASRAIAAAPRASNAARPQPVRPQPVPQPQPQPQPQPPTIWQQPPQPQQPPMTVYPPTSTSLGEALLNRLTALGIGGGASYIPAKTLVEIIAGIIQQSWFTQDIQVDCIISLIIIGGIISHSAILAALKGKIVRDFQ